MTEHDSSLRDGAGQAVSTKGFDPLRDQIEAMLDEQRQVVRRAIAAADEAHMSWLVLKAEVEAEAARLSVLERHLRLPRQSMPKVGAVPCAPNGRTLQACIMLALEGMTDGASVRDLLGPIAELYGRNVDRTSVSPQLSRLKRAGHVVEIDGRWRTSAIEARQGGNEVPPQSGESAVPEGQTPTPDGLNGGSHAG